MKTLIYIGNMPQNGRSGTALMGLHIGLLRRHFRVYAASGQSSKMLRLLDMIATFFRRQRQAECVIIDVYSTLNFYYALVLALLCRAFSKPYVAYLHGGNLPARLRQSPRMSRAIFQHSRTNVAPSGYLHSAFEQAGFPCSIIPNFIEIQHYTFIQRTHLRPRFLWVRAFEKTYHPEMCIRVFAAIQQQFPDAQLCMVGPDKDGSLGICQQLVLELGLQSQVRFMGQLPKKAWLALAAEYDIFLSTTHFDNTPVSVLEAMALGLPVVSTEVGGIPFLIQHGENGLLSPDNEPVAMIKNIQMLLQTPSFAEQLSRKGRQKAESFDWLKVEQLWLNVLDPKHVPER